jgi:putative acetyltransferase
MTLLTRSETPSDYNTIREINTAAFGRPAEAQVVERVRAQADFNLEFSLVAELDGEVVGHVLFSEMHLEGADEAVKLLGLGPVAVRPDHQRQGVGGSLIREGLGRAKSAGFRAVILIGHPTYYPRFGFAPASRYEIKSTYNVPDDVFMALPLYNGALEGVRGTLHYSPAFQGV